MQIFRAATINNAREFKIDSQVGTIEPGKIRQPDPTEKITIGKRADAYDTISIVWLAREGGF